MEIPNDKHKIKKEWILLNKDAKILDVSAENKIIKKAKIENEFEREIRKKQKKITKKLFAIRKRKNGWISGK